MTQIHSQPIDSPLTPTHAELKPKVVTIDPLTRIEGHLKIEVELGSVDGQRQVVDAWSTGTLFRGFEQILIDRELEIETRTKQ